MATKTIADFTKELKTEYPTLTKGVNDEVIALANDEYEALIAKWAAARLAQQEQEASDAAASNKAETDKATAQAKLEALGLTVDDLAALGL
jgi:hypothetical protein